jgi:hypothetical protein
MSIGDPMALGSTKSSVREQLELHFDSYLAQVVSYLKDGYRELGFSQEAVEEIAATVIVRVSHSNPEPEHLDQALFASADDVVRARRPRMSQQKMLDGATGSLRSEMPASLPSLRLIQRLSRVPASNTDDAGAADALESLGRLSLPKPPVDLQASLITSDLNGLKELEGASIPSAQIPSLQHEPRFQPVIPSYDDSLDELTELRARTKLHEPGELERELDEQLAGSALNRDAKPLPGHDEDPADEAPLGMRQPSLLALKNSYDAPKALLDIPEEALELHHTPMDATLAGVHKGRVVSEAAPHSSSIPPTKESVVPPAIQELSGITAAASNVEEMAGVEPGPPRSKSRSAKSPSSRSKPSPKSNSSKPALPKPPSLKARVGATPNPRSPSKTQPKNKAAKRARSVGAEQHSTRGFGILPDELSMLSMVGFPDNPRRAARLCVAALADELGLSSSDGFQGPAELVAKALASLSEEFAVSGHVGAHAALQWQRVARQMTLRALFNR